LLNIFYAGVLVVKRIRITAVFRQPMDVALLAEVLIRQVRLAAAQKEISGPVVEDPVAVEEEEGEGVCGG
jgi:hypothetical protein